MRHSQPGSFIIQNHRGAGDAAAENTLEAFEFSWKLGMYPEADLRTTRDGVIVPFHDEDFSRVVRAASPELASKGVADTTWDELRKLVIGGDRFPGRHVSSVREVFEQMKGFPDRHLYMDIKNVDLNQLAGEVTAHGVRQQVILASSDYDLIRRWRSLAPWSRTLLWMGGSEPALIERIERLHAADFADVTQLQVHIHLRPRTNPSSDNRFALSDHFLTHLAQTLDARRILFQALPWHISDPDIYCRLLELGVKSFATDYPEQTLEAVRRYYRKGS